MNTSFAQPAPVIEGDDLREAIILVAESSESIGRELVEQLCADRYRAVLARTAQHASVFAAAQPIRAIVLGTLDTPRGALELLEEIRRAGQPNIDSVWDECLPAIVLSLRTGQLELLRAFEMGADDFIVREGAYYLELRARLKAILRRIERLQRTQLRIGPLNIDTHAHLVRVADTPVELCRLEYELLIHLARNPTGVSSKEELLRAIWHQRASGGARTVDSHASRLRRKLRAAGAHGFVVNVWGVGYRLL